MANTWHAPPPPVDARARLTRGLYRLAAVTLVAASVRDLAFGAPWVWLPPALGALATAPPAIAGWSDYRARAWLLLVGHIMVVSTVGVLGAPTAVPVVLVCALLGFLTLDLDDERSTLRVAVAASTAELVGVALLPVVYPGPASQQVSDPQQFAFVVVFSGGTLMTACAWLASTLAAATRRAEARADQLSRAIDARARFLGTMSHELRTPAAAILGFADLVDNEASDEARARHIAVIKRNGKHLLALLDDLLDLTKVDAGELAVHLQDTALAPLMSDAIVTVRAQHPRADLTIDASTQGEVPATLHTDGRRVKQIVLNLLTNASKFARARVVVSVYPEGDQLLICVDDDGPGVPDDEAPYLFEAFWQGTSGKASKKGTGLGLMLSARLALALGGSLTYEPTQATGARFVLRLPLRAPGPSLPPQSIEAVAAPAPPVWRWADGLRCLVADDNPDLRMLMTHELSRRGAIVVEAADGQEAVDAILQGVDLVFMDVDMPHLDGLAATRAVRQAGLTTPIVALTALAMRGDREKCLDAGCDDYLGKPVDVDALMTIAARLSGRSRSTTLPAKRRGQAKLAALRSMYAAKLPGILDELEALHAEGDAEALQAAAHRLAGTAGSFGLPEVTDTARSLEEALRTGTELAHTASLLAAVRGAAERSAGGAPP